MPIPTPPEVKFIRTLHNQLIIGKVTDSQDTITVRQPYNIIPSAAGLELTPLDFELVGKEIEEITLSKSQLMYFTDPSLDLKTSYLKVISGIETEVKKELILG